MSAVIHPLVTITIFPPPPPPPPPPHTHIKGMANVFWILSTSGSMYSISKELFNKIY